MPQPQASSPARDIHQHITNQIVEKIEAGAGSFEMPWHRSGPALTRPVNAHTGRAYRGVNILALWVAAEQAGYGSGYWATYQQWGKLGAQVRRGQKGTPIAFYKTEEREIEDDETGEVERTTYWFARASWVFNAEQVEGWTPPPVARAHAAKVIEAVEVFLGATGAQVRHGGDRAYYRPAADYIQMPERNRFKGSSTSSPTEAYYATLLHELTHWTGHEKRLDRRLSNRFGDQAYAMEELIAELGAAFLCADLGITNRPRADHAAYIASWLEVLKRDKRAIFSAASKASQAADYLADLQVPAELSSAEPMARKASR